MIEADDEAYPLSAVYAESDAVQYLGYEQAWLDRNTPAETKTLLDFFDACLALPLTNWEEETKVDADLLNIEDGKQDVTYSLPTRYVSEKR